MKDKEKSGKNNQILSGHHHQVWLLRQRPTTTKGSQQQQQQNKYVSSWLDWSIDRSIDWLDRKAKTKQKIWFDQW